MLATGKHLLVYRISEDAIAESYFLPLPSAWQRI